MQECYRMLLNATIKSAILVSYKNVKQVQQNKSII